VNMLLLPNPHLIQVPGKSKARVRLETNLSKQTYFNTIFKSQVD